MAALALVMQAALLFSPLVELRNARAASVEPYRIGMAQGAGVVVPARGSSAPHDETTCPACVARSLHARTEALAAVPVSTTEARAPAERTAADAPQPAHPSSHLSRAPPVVA